MSSTNLKKVHQTSDGKNIVTSNALPEWCVLGMVGAGDSATVIGAGNRFEMSTNDPENDDTLNFSFIDPVYVLAGTGIILDAKLGDYIRFEVCAPASSPVSNEGAGNCDKVDTGSGFNIIVPAENGDWDIDVDSANVVPAANGDGHWDWVMTQTGRGTLTPNATATGGYNIYDNGMYLNMFATDVPLLGTNIVVDFGIENIRAKMISPHWDWNVTLHCDNSNHTVQVGFFLKAGRARTYVNSVMS